MKKLKEFYSYGCLSVKTPDLLAHIKEIQDALPQDQIESIEEDPHITILYGFHEVDGQKVIDTMNIDEVTFTIRGISIFDNENKVLKFDIESSQLHSLNSQARASFPYTSTYWEYKPHLTIAYMDKSWDGIDQISTELIGKSFTSNTIEYSNRYNEITLAKK